MKKVFLAAFMLLFVAGLQAGGPHIIDKVDSLTVKTSDLQTSVQDLQTSYQQLLMQLEQARQTSIQADSSNVSKPIIKAPGTIDEANALLLVLLGFVQFILTGFVPKDKLPRWLSPFMLSVMVAVVVTVVGLTVGHLSLPDAFAFFVGVTGVGNIFHQIKKPKASKTAPTPAHP